MKDPAGFLLDSANSGVYAASTPVTALRQEAVARGLAWFDLDLQGVTDKLELLGRCQTALGLPPSFGHNWDALADCLGDFSWQPARGYVVHCRNGDAFAHAAPAEFATWLEILAGAATYWQMQDKMFVALLDAKTRGGRKLKTLPG
jgi:hypothetical protein